jgi:hypothetical protein
MSPEDHAEDLAKKLVGNWREFESFCWHGQPEEDGEQWAIVTTNSRDSDHRTKSNAAAIDKEMEAFPADQCKPHRAGHWACGWVEGWEIRVYAKDGTLTPAFLAYSELHSALEAYPVLDDSDYCRRQHEACLKNIDYEGRNLVDDDAPEDWPVKVYGWLVDNDERALEEGDDDEAYPTKDQIKPALKALGMLATEQETE